FARTDFTQPRKRRADQNRRRTDPLFVARLVFHLAPVPARHRPTLMKTLTAKSPLAALDIPTIDQVMVEERAAAFTKRSIKTNAKLAGLKMVVSMMDLTTLEGKDTPGKVAYLCHKAAQPIDPRYDVPSCAAVC